MEWAKYNIRFVGIAPGPISNSGAIAKLDPFKIYIYIIILIILKKECVIQMKYLI